MKKSPSCVSVSSPSVVVVPAVATPVIVMSVSTPAARVAVPAAVVLLVVGPLAMAVLLLLLLVRRFVPVARVAAPAAHLGWVMPVGGVVMVPRAPSDYTPTSRRLLLWRCSESVIQLLHVELPRHVVHLQTGRHQQQHLFEMDGCSKAGRTIALFSHRKGKFLVKISQEQKLSMKPI